jgi:hypothetical protein
MNDRGKRTKNVPRQHHFVPRWYLQHWCGPNERLFRARKTPSRILFDEQLPTNIGREKDLNTIFGSSGNAGGSFEDQITRFFDEPFSALHKKMITAEGQGLQNLTDTERFEVARHLSALQVRNPRIIRDQLAPALARPSKFPSWLSPQELKEMKEFEPRFRKILNSNYDWSKWAAHMILNDLDKEAEILLPKGWIVVQTHPPHGEKSLLITGELPFISTHDFASPKSIYIFPMTPSIGLVIHKI